MLLHTKTQYNGKTVFGILYSPKWNNHLIFFMNLKSVLQVAILLIYFILANSSYSQVGLELDV